MKALIRDAGVMSKLVEDGSSDLPGQVVWIGEVFLEGDTSWSCDGTIFEEAYRY